MIDLDALRMNSRLSWSRAQQNLALLDHYFWLRSSRSDRHRFLKTYLENRSEPVADARQFAAGIESSTRAWAERLWRRWGRRCCSTNKYFQALQGPKSAGRSPPAISIPPRSSRCWLIRMPPSPARRRSCSRTRGRQPSPRRRCWWAASRRGSFTSGSTARSGSIPGSTWCARRAPGARGRPASTWSAGEFPLPATWPSWPANGPSAPAPSPGSCRTRPTWSTIKQDNVTTLAEYVRKVLPTLDPLGSEGPSSPPQPGPGPSDPGPPRAIALTPRSEGK